jgi:formamidase
MARAATLLGISQAEVRNRCTISGGIEIARLPGVVQLTMLAPLDLLDRAGLGNLAQRQYGL